MHDLQAGWKPSFIRDALQNEVVGLVSLQREHVFVSMTHDTALGMKGQPKS